MSLPRDGEQGNILIWTDWQKTSRKWHERQTLRELWWLAELLAYRLPDCWIAKSKSAKYYWHYQASRSTSIN